MKKIDGIQVGSQIFRYGNNAFQTDNGMMLKFVDGAEKLSGPFPGCTWDRFYDEVMIELAYPYINKLVLKQRRAVPVIIRDFGGCPHCSNKSDYKFCSVSCWFFYTIEVERDIISSTSDIAKIDRQIHFVQQMVKLFGAQVDAEQLNPTQL
jgi:hypothetical protein